MRISSVPQEEVMPGARTLTEGWEAMNLPQRRQMIEATTNRIVVGQTVLQRSVEPTSGS